MAASATSALPVVMIENGDAQGPFLVVCEHASNYFPPAFGTLGLTSDARQAHIAWDPGALPLARRLARALNAPLLAAGISRLVCDLNRPPDALSAMAERSEAYDIPGNANLSKTERLSRTETVYLPFHAALHERIALALAAGIRPAIVTVHSFTRVYFGKSRDVELGIIHDADTAFARAVYAEAKARGGLDCRLNEPYSAADGVTHLLRLHATPYGLTNVMLEIRNDLIADDAAATAMGDGLASVLTAALARIRGAATAGAAV